MWPESTVFILGGGPTLPKSLEQCDLSGKKVLGVNNAFGLGGWVDVNFFTDAKFYWWNRHGLRCFRGLKITVNDMSDGRYKSLEGRRDLKIVERGKFRGLETNPNRIAWNRSSGGAAINVAYHLGAKRIVLVGYDMRLVNNRKNWKPHVRERTKLNPFVNFLKDFEPIRRDAERLGVEILNATPKSALRTFPSVDLAKVSQDAV